MMKYDLNNSEVDRKTFYGRLSVVLLIFICLVVATIFALSHIDEHRSDESFSITLFVLKIGFAYILFFFSACLWMNPDSKDIAEYSREILFSFKMNVVFFALMITSVVIIITVYTRF